MSRTEAQKRADKKYIAKTYKRIAVNTRLEYLPKIEAYKKKNNINSDSGIFNAAMMYCIENDIDLNGNGGAEAGGEKQK